MRSSYRIMSIFGISIELHVTFILLLVILLGYGWFTAGFISGLKLVLLFVLLFAVVVSHELVHSGVAMLWGIKVPKITLLPIGGAAHVELPEKPHIELIVAVSGPLFNIVFAFFVLVLLWFAYPGAELFPDADLLKMSDAILSFDGLLRFLLHINIVLAVFNLLPIFPMDGGRVFRAILALFMDYARATAVAANMGQYLSLFMVFAGILLPNLWIILIGALIYMAAGQELRVVRLRHALAGLSLGDAAVRDYEFVHESMSLSDFMENAIKPQLSYYPVVDASGAVVGMFNPELVEGSAGGGSSVGEFMVRDYVTFSSSDIVSDKLLGILDKSFVFVEEGGKIIGYITPEYLSALARFREIRGSAI